MHHLPMREDHSVHWGINPLPLKKQPLFLAKPPPPPLNLKSANCPSPPFKPISPVYWFHVTPPLKRGFFRELQKY